MWSKRSQAFWALRGGYGTLRILDRLSLDRQSRDPIPFIGFSDNTTIHVRQVRSGVVSFHGPHAGGPFPPDVDQWFRRTLCEEAPPGPLPRIDGAVPPRTLVPGRAQGPLFGGNLALLAALCGSQDGVSAAGCILCLEDVGEPAYRLDRLLLGLTEGIAGLAMGRFTGAPNGEDAAVADVVEAFAGLLGVPAVGDLPFGHVDGNFVLPMGAGAVLDADGGSLSVTEPAVRFRLQT
jgi:muramoyltetrapeptide carboxypeptidase